MKKLGILLGTIALLAAAWVLVLGDLTAAAGRAATYQLHRGETVLAYPGVVMHERVRNFGAAADALVDPPQANPALKRRGGEDASEQPLSLDEVLEKVNADTLSSTWLQLAPERRWNIYTSAEMRPVFLGTRIVGGGLASIFLLALLRTAGRRLFKLLFAPVMILWTYRRLKPGESHGAARWADEESVGRLAPREGEAPLVFGTVGRGRLRRQLVGVPEKQHYEHVYLAAPPGAGKTSGLITPNLLTEPGTRSIVATDPKGELLPLTYTQLARTYGAGNVLVVDFANPWISKRYNPLAFVHDATSATLFADTLVQNTGVSQKDPFWGNINRQIIAAVALHLVRTEGDPPLAALANFLAGIPPKEIKERLRRSPAPEAVRVATSQLESMEKNDKLLGAVFTEIAGRFEFMLDADIRAVTGGNDVDFARLGREPTVLYLPLYLDRNEFYKPLTACFFANLFGQLTDAAKATRTKTLPTKVMCYMDEFGVMGKIPNFEARLATVRGYGIGCLMVVQSKSQLDSQYGEDAAKSILQNANTKMCLSRVTGEDARMFSELSGNATVLTTTQSGTRQTFDVLQQHGGRSRSEAQRALITPDELRTMGEDVFAVLAGEHAIRARQRPYYKDRALRRLVPDLAQTDPLAPLRRSYPLPDPGLGVEIPDQGEVRDAVETRQAEGGYVEPGQAPPQPPLASASGNGHPPRNAAVRSATRIKVIERRRPAPAPVSSASEVEPEHARDETFTPTPRPTTTAPAPQPDGAAMLLEPHVRVLELLAEGRTLSQVATELGYRHQTVKNYLAAIYARLGVQTRGEEGRRDAVAIARERGVISQEIERPGDQEH